MNWVISVSCDSIVVSKQSTRYNMWTEITRPKYARAGRRYASDLTDAEWRLIEPFMSPVKRLGRPRETGERRKVLGKQAPLAATSGNIQDRVDNSAQVGYKFWSRQS